MFKNMKLSYSISKKIKSFRLKTLVHTWSEFSDVASFLNTQFFFYKTLHILAIKASKKKVILVVQ